MMPEQLTSEAAEKRPVVRELLARDDDFSKYDRIRALWKRHSLAEDGRDLPGLISTLTSECVYELVQTGHRWEGHAGATRFYTELLTAFPDIAFSLTYIVIGPQGVCEEAVVTGTHLGSWLGYERTGHKMTWRNVIFFPWDPKAELFSGERVYSFFPEAAGPLWAPG